MATRSQRHHQPLPTIVLFPRTGPPNETWDYTLPNGRGGVVIGDLAWSAFHCLSLSRLNGWSGVHLEFAKTRWSGLRSTTVTLHGGADLHRLRIIDVADMAWRHGLQVRGAAVPRGWRERMEDVVAGLVERMPVAWPAVP